MLGSVLKLGAVGYSLSHAYTNYIKSYTGVTDTVTKLAQDVFSVMQLPFTMISEGEAAYNESKICYDAVNDEKVENLKMSFWNPFKYSSLLAAGASEFKCNYHGVKAAALYASGFALLGAAVYKGLPVAITGVKCAYGASQKLFAALTTLVAKTESSKSKENTFQEQRAEFADLYKQFYQLIPTKLATVQLRGDLPVIELETEMSFDDVKQALTQAKIDAKSLVLSPEGYIQKIILKTTSAMDLCITFKA
jgi:hypothetical protein